MAATFRQRFLAELAQNERDMTALFSDLQARIAARLLAEQQPDGTISPADGERVRALVGSEVMTMFLGGDLAGPFSVIGGIVVPRSRYFAVLWQHVEAVTRLEVDKQAAILTRKLAKAPDVLAALRRARRNPFAAATVAEQAGFRARPFLEYDPLHRFVDPRGYVLSTRIWDTALSTRRKIDLLLTEGIASGMSSQELAKQLEPFLQPGRQLVVTKRPYGTTASYDAMRLARTEITAAASRAHWMSAMLNPFVEEYHVVVSTSHVVLDICDQVAEEGPYRWDDPASPHVPLHPHCLCNEQDVVLGETAELVEDLRSQLLALQDELTGGAGRGPMLIEMVGPLVGERFVRLLLADKPADVGEFDL